MPIRKPAYPYHLIFPRRLERRWLFVTSFTLLCIAFVPVIFYLILFLAICPISGLIVGSPTRGDLTAICCLIYIALFAYTGFEIHRSAMKIRHRTLRQAVLILFLILPIGGSFPRVLTCQSWGTGGGGTYNFWEAVGRYHEKRK